MKATNYQKQQLRMHQIKFSHDISFDEAKKMIDDKELETKKSRVSWMKSNNLDGSGLFDRWLKEDKPKHKPLKDSHETKWEKMKGIIVEGGQNRAVKSESGGRYYISNFEDVSSLPTGTKVSFLGGHPGDHRGVSKNLKKIK